MKRSKDIHLKRLNKNLKKKENRWVRGLGQISVVAAGAYMLTGCDSEDGYIYRSIQECSLDNPGYDRDCATAYQRALAEWRQTAPRYNQRFDCEYDFGNGQCEQYSPYFIPLMAGFLLGNNYATDDDFDLDYYRSKPLGSSRSRRSPAYNRWVSAKGDLYGNYGKSQIKVSKSAFKGSKGTARVMGRGGFGSSVSSRSSGG